MKGLMLKHPSIEERIDLIRTLQAISAARGITLQTCAVGSEPTEAGRASGKCIDDELVARITGTGIRAGKDKNQRRQCGCKERFFVLLAPESPLSVLVILDLSIFPH